MNPLKLLRSGPFVCVAILLIGLIIPAGQAAAQAGLSLPGQFAYVESGSRLYLVRGNLEEPILLLQAKIDHSIFNPHFSPDGRFLAFCMTSSAAVDVPDLFYLDTQTLEKVKVTSEGSCSYDWSPDGKTLIYSTPPSMETPSTQADGIWSYARETGEVKLLIPTDFPVIDPRWSPDGHTISYFDFCFECVGQFYTHNLDTGATLEWSHKGTEDYIGPDVDWSPDGSLLAYDKELWMYASAGKTYGLYLASNNGETRQEIYSQAGQGAYFPIWSPDGKRIAFASFESFVIGNYMNVRGDLMIVSPDGSNAKNLYSSTYEVYPQAWSPDGRYLLMIEPTSMPGDSLQEQQLVLIDVETGSLLWKQSSLGSTSADWAPVPVVDESLQQPADKLAGHSGLLFVSPDYALAFYEPVSAQMQKLTPPFLGTGFSISPDGRTVLFGDQIVSVQSQADGSITTNITEAAHPKELSTVSWSPDGQTYGYVDQETLWLADLAGSREKLAEGNMPPDWSYDGHWMAFCDREGRLWIAETGKPPDWIVQQAHCQVSWSPVQSILAYATFPAFDFMDQANGTAFLYDPVSGTTREIAQKVSTVDWSPDGKLVSIQRITWMGASNYGFSLSAVNPESGQELLIEEFNAEMYGNHDWIDQANGYIVGKYKFQADLLNKGQLADILFDASYDGTSLLVGSGDMQAFQVGCREVETGSYYPLAEMSLHDLPGVSASFSPDGTYTLVSNDEWDKTSNWLARCGQETPQQFETRGISYQQYFSPDSSWLVMEETNAAGEEISRISLREVESGQMRQVQAGLQTRSAWFQMPEAPLVPLSTSSVEMPPSVSKVPNGADSPIPVQADLADNRIVMFSLLLWSVALIAIVLLMLHLWRNSSAPAKPEAPPAEPSPDEKKIVPAAESAPTPSHEEVEQNFRDGMELVRAGKASEGTSRLTMVVTAEPGNNVAWFWLGIASARQSDYRSAERCFLQAKRHGHPEADKALEWLKKQKG